MARNEVQNRSAWRVAVPPLVFVAVLTVAVAVHLVTGDTNSAALILSGGVGLIALWAVGDGLARALGRATYLGTGRGIDRVIGLVQVGASASLAIALLPNAAALLNAIVHLGS
jgi:hypothetical protein